MDITILLNKIVSETNLLKEISAMSSLITSGKGTAKVLSFLLAKVPA